MYYIILNEPQESYDVAVLLKYRMLTHEGLRDHYVEPLERLGLPKNSCIGLNLENFGKKKPTAKEIRTYLTDELLPVIRDCKSKLLICTDGDYFKVLTKKTKVESHLGYVLPCVIPDYEHLNVVYVPNYSGLFYSDSLQGKIDIGIQTAYDFLQGSYEEIGTNVIKYSEYIPCVPAQVKAALERLHQYDSLTCDTETFSLRHTDAKLGTIGFAWNEHEGICFDVEHLLRTTGTGFKSRINEVRVLFKEFFETYQGRLIYHNCPYDIKILIYYLWMDDILDTEGLLHGLEVLTRNFDDTRIIAYLATNSCAGNKLSLKDLAHEFAGNYAQSDIDDITKIKNQDLMQYNLVDCLSTWFVYNKYYPMMVADDQEKVYHFFKDILKNIIQMELTGMPIDMARTKEVDSHIKAIIDEHWDILNNSPLLKRFIDMRKQQIMEQKNAEYKKKRITVDEVKYEFNPNSNKELIALIHEFLGYEVHSTTDTGQPSVGGDELKGHMKRSTDEDAKAVLNAILKIQEGDKIRNTFISKFLDAVEGPDGWHYLFGSFNLGGTKSGRLSSSNPNLQNLPNGSTYGKLVKSCFRAPPGMVTLHFEKLNVLKITDEDLDILFQIKNLAHGNLIKANNRDEFDKLSSKLSIKGYLIKIGAFDIDVGWLFYGLDYASLEDRINTLLTKDPNKVKVYTDGYDGHSLRAYSYFKEQMPDIEDTVESINSIAERYPVLRQDSKAPTFALTYLGTWLTLVTNCGFSPEVAKQIEKNYHDLYQVSDAWVKAKIEQACVDGYVTLAFGLRLRTPILRKTILDAKSTPNQASAEKRTAGNAVSGQSYGLLNSRAGVDLQQRVLASEYRTDIRPSAHIHDAQYGMVRNTPEAVAWLNENIVDCVEWQELPELQHDGVKLTGDLGIFYPNWSNEITLPHNATPAEVAVACREGIQKYEAKKNQ
ncbi:DNA polymerase [Vibrio phage BUCT194]|uniref:DNA polymerase n=1 Tax=Vibrio phage BUCT194 TaxID=2859072 RepID=A0AAE9BPH3_9CAUD|nr:DNA polymerase [Vibrio phage BUCT194]UAW01136.1 DNA polymerase [Vibrio phage BUCT194]